MLREATIDDAAEIARIHCAALPQDLLPRLGARFLRNSFYPRVIESTNALIVVDADDKVLRAFVVFAYDTAAFVREAMGNRFRLLFVVLRSALRDASVAGEVLSHARGIRPTLNLSVNPSDIPELFVMATSPGCQSQGVGGKLIDAGLGLLSQRDDRCIVKTSSDDARRFYERHGFKAIGEETRGNRKIAVLFRAAAG